MRMRAPGPVTHYWGLKSLWGANLSLKTPGRDAGTLPCLGLESPPGGYLSLKRIWRIPASFLLLAVIIQVLAGQSYAAPIQRIQGVISEVGEGYLLLEPDDRSAPRKFILRWKARFTPPKLPIKGDRVLILYKDKDQGSVIYGVNYLGANRNRTKTRDNKNAQ